MTSKLILMNLIFVLLGDFCSLITIKKLPIFFTCFEKGILPMQKSSFSGCKWTLTDVLFSEFPVRKSQTRANSISENWGCSADAALWREPASPSGPVVEEKLVQRCSCTPAQHLCSCTPPKPPFCQVREFSGAAAVETGHQIHKTKESIFCKPGRGSYL